MEGWAIQCGLRNLRVASLPLVPHEGGLEDEGAVQSITSKPGETVSDLAGTLTVHQIGSNSFFK